MGAGASTEGGTVIPDKLDVATCKSLAGDKFDAAAFDAAKDADGFITRDQYAERAETEANDKPTATVTLYYWGVASRAHYALFVAAASGNSSDVNWVTGVPYPGTPNWETYEKKSYSGQLPYLEDSSTGVKLGQSMAIARYFAQKYNMYADVSMADFAASEQMIEQAADVHTILAKAHYTKEEGGRTAAMDSIFAEDGTIPKLLTQCEALIQDSGSFGVGDKLLPGDCVFAATLDLLRRLEPMLLEEFPKCGALHGKVTATDGVKGILAQSRYPYFLRKSDPLKGEPEEGK